MSTPLDSNLPAVLNCHLCRDSLWHALAALITWELLDYAALEHFKTGFVSFLEMDDVADLK